MSSLEKAIQRLIAPFPRLNLDQSDEFQDSDQSLKSVLMERERLVRVTPTNLEERMMVPVFVFSSVSHRRLSKHDPNNNRDPD